MHTRTQIRTLAAVLTTCCAAQARGQMLTEQGPPQHRVVHKQTLAARVNPLGLVWDGRLAYRLRLYQSESVALRDNFLGLGIAAGASPTFGRIGVLVEAQPATVFGLWASFEFMPYFGTMDLFQSFPNAASDFSEQAIKSRSGLPQGDPRRGYPAMGSMLTLGANLNLKVGPVALRSQLRAYRPDFQMREGDTTLYDQTTDLLMANRGVALVNDLDVIFQTDFGLMVGGRYTLGVPLYAEASGGADNSNHRVGPFIAYRFSDRDGAAFNQPTVALVAGWWLKHRYRTGAETSQAIPCVALAFNFVGDLMDLGGPASR